MSTQDSALPDSGIVPASETDNSSVRGRGPDCDPHGGDPPLGGAFHRVMRALMFHEKPVPELDALPMAQLRLLWTVRHSADATMKDFSERLSVSQSTVTQLADRLVRRGLVERHPDDADRRVVRLRTSTVGHAALQKAEDQGRAVLVAVWNTLSDEEKDRVMLGLETLGRCAEAVRAAEGRPLPQWHGLRPDSGDEADQAPDASGSQPVVDLMSRRVRGRTAGQ